MFDEGRNPTTYTRAALTLCPYALASCLSPLGFELFDTYLQRATQQRPALVRVGGVQPVVIDADGVLHVVHLHCTTPRPYGSIDDARVHCAAWGGRVQRARDDTCRKMDVKSGQSGVATVWELKKTRVMGYAKRQSVCQAPDVY